MVRVPSAAVALAASVAAPSFAQQPAPPAPVLVDPRIAALRDDALEHDRYAWEITEGLTTEVGQRLAGSEAEARARSWAVAKLRALGFQNIRVDEFPVENTLRGRESAEILAPFPQSMAVTALGNSGLTGPEGVSGQVVGFGSIDELRAAPDSAVRGKIVFIDHHMPANQDG